MLTIFLKKWDKELWSLVGFKLSLSCRERKRSMNEIKKNCSSMKLNGSKTKGGYKHTKNTQMRAGKRINVRCLAIISMLMSCLSSMTMENTLPLQFVYVFFRFLLFFFALSLTRWLAKLAGLLIVSIEKCIELLSYKRSPISRSKIVIVR